MGLFGTGSYPLNPSTEPNNVGVFGGQDGSIGYYLSAQEAYEKVKELADSVQKISDKFDNAEVSVDDLTVSVISLGQQYETLKDDVDNLVGIVSTNVATITDAANTANAASNTATQVLTDAQNALTTINDTLAKINGAQATANTLQYGAQATASIDTATFAFHFGIPAGKDGTGLKFGPADPLPTDGDTDDFWLNTSTQILFGPKTTANGWPTTGTNLKGANGFSVKTGTTPPSDNLGVIGDSYIDYTAFKLYVKGASGWGTGVSFKGKDGKDGANAPDAKTILNGNTAPTAAIGKEGDFYIQTSAQLIFGPKVGTNWGTGTSIRGLDGKDGKDGVITDPSGNQLVKIGDFGLGGDAKAVTDVNTIVGGGWFTADNSAANLPTNADHVVIYQGQTDATHKYQIAVYQTVGTANSQLSFRSMDGTTWSAWTKFGTAAFADVGTDVLGVGSFGIGGDEVDWSGLDLNVLNKTGFYLADTDTTNTPSTGNRYSVIHINISAAEARQIAYGSATGTGNNESFTRHKINSQWGDWERVDGADAIFSINGGLPDSDNNIKIGTLDSAVLSNANLTGTGMTNGTYNVSSATTTGIPAGIGAGILVVTGPKAPIATDKITQILFDLTGNTIQHRERAYSAAWGSTWTPIGGTAANAGGQGFTVFADVATMRKTAPKNDGDIAYLLGYNTGSTVGGGWVRATKKTGAGTFNDDGGYTFTGGPNYNWCWVRDKEISELDVTDFGAVTSTDMKATTTTDCTDSVIAMGKMIWQFQPTLSKANVGIQFPAGDFVIKPIDWDTIKDRNGHSLFLSSFRIKGEGDANGGYFPRTRLHTVEGQTAPMFKGTFSRTEITNIYVIGPHSGSTNEVNTSAGAATAGEYQNNTSKMGFYENTGGTGGTFNTFFCVRLENLGGVGIKVMNTLDTKFEQFFSSQCSARVIDGGWTNQASQAWDHGTAICLRKMNIQTTHAGDKDDKSVTAIYLPRHANSLIEDVWVEHCSDNVTPIDLSAGSWLVRQLCIESSKTGGNFKSCRFVSLISDRVNAGKDDNSHLKLHHSPNLQVPVDEEPFDVQERGYINIETYGIEARDGATFSGVIAPTMTINNDNGSARWFKVGHFLNAGNGAGWDVEVVGAPGIDGGWDTNVVAHMSGMQNTRSIIGMHKNRSRLEASYYHLGSSPALLDVRMERTLTLASLPNAADGGGNQGHIVLNTLYIKVPAYTSAIGLYIRQIGQTRFQSGAYRAWFEADGSVISETDLNAITTAEKIPQRMSIGTSSAGISANNDDTNLYLTAGVAGKVQVNNKVITGVAAPVADNDVANRKFVLDQVKAGGGSIKTVDGTGPDGSGNIDLTDVMKGIKTTNNVDVFPARLDGSNGSTLPAGSVLDIRIGPHGKLPIWDADTKRFNYTLNASDVNSVSNVLVQDFLKGTSALLAPAANTGAVNANKDDFCYEGFKGSTLYVSNFNLDGGKSSGLYSGYNPNNNNWAINTPDDASGRGFMLIHHRLSGTTFNQLAWAPSADLGFNGTYSRYTTDGGATWSTWRATSITSINGAHADVGGNVTIATGGSIARTDNMDNVNETGTYYVDIKATPPSQLPKDLPVSIYDLILQHVEGHIQAGISQSVEGSIQTLTAVGQSATNGMVWQRIKTQGTTPGNPVVWTEWSKFGDAPVITRGQTGTGADSTSMAYSYELRKWSDGRFECFLTGTGKSVTGADMPQVPNGTITNNAGNINTLQFNNGSVVCNVASAPGFDLSRVNKLLQVTSRVDNVARLIVGVNMTMSAGRLNMNIINPSSQGVTIAPKIILKIEGYMS